MCAQRTHKSDMSSPLGSYLQRNGITDSMFALQIGRDRSTVSRLRRGVLRPTLDLAAAIERVTEGQVPISGWVLPEIQMAEAIGTRPAPQSIGNPGEPEAALNHRPAAPIDS
ncbi:MAG: helix-turn-helix domain-containing protein, partial [Pseudomonadota bacterium]|nr:helix-turn-helix domain-containing protein [Pseudomonadota bacterium]